MSVERYVTGVTILVSHPKKGRQEYQLSPSDLLTLSKKPRTEIAESLMEKFKTIESKEEVDVILHSIYEVDVTCSSRLGAMACSGALPVLLGKDPYHLRGKVKFHS